MLQARSMTGGFSGLRKGFPSCQEPSRAGTLRAADSPSQKSGEEPSHPRGKNPAENIKGTENPADPAGFRAGRLTGEPVGCSVTTAARMGDSHMPQRDISGLIRILRGLLQNIGNTPAPASANDAMIALEAYKDRVLEALAQSHYERTESPAPLTPSQSEEFRSLIQEFARNNRLQGQNRYVMSSCEGSFYRGIAGITVGAAFGGPAGAIAGFLLACVDTITSC
jgi:hypothetical protein